MKKKLLSKVIIITVVISLFATGVYAGTIISSYKTVRGNTATVEREDVHKNRIALKVNGQTVKKSTWYAGNTTYVPLRDAAEMLGAEVVYNADTQTAEINTKASEVPPTTGEIKQINKLIVDNSDVKATLVSIEKVVDDYYKDGYYEVKFAVENKRSETITFQAREISADGKMITDASTIMSQEVASGKKADAILTIRNYNGPPPAIVNNFEMLLHAFSWDSDFDAKYEVEANF